MKSDLVIEGANLDVSVRGVDGALELVQQGGEADLANVETVLVEGTDLDFKLDGVGDAELSLEATRAEILNVYGPLVLDAVETTLSLTGSNGSVEARIDGGGGVELAKLFSGARLELEEAPLVLTEGSGVIEIDTDANVDLRDIRGPLRITGYAGDVVGTKLLGTAEIETSGGKVELKSIGGQTSITGDDLQVAVKDVKANLTVRTRSSNVSVDSIDGVLDIENDFGDVKVSDAKKSVTIRNSGGDVEVRKLEGPDRAADRRTPGDDQHRQLRRREG